MSSQPSKAHIEAVVAAEGSAVRALEAEMKRVVERQDIVQQANDANFESSIIESIALQIKGKKQMERLLEGASDRKQTSGFLMLADLQELTKVSNQI